MSRIVKGLALTEDGEVKSNLGVIDVTRAVSKIRFAFAKYEGDSETGDIVGIELGDQLIAAEQYILPVAPTGEDTQPDYGKVYGTSNYLGDYQANLKTANYASALLIGKAQTGDNAFTPGTDQPIVPTNNVTTVPVTDDPALKAWDQWILSDGVSTMTDQQKARAYNQLMNEFTKQTVYLRESDKQLTGKIYYRISSEGEVKVAPFSMATSTVQDFARNHVWVVYSYFSGGKLYVRPTVAPWIDAPELTYTLKMSTQMRLFDSWLYRYDTDNNYEDWSTNWTGSHMVVSDGRVTTPVAPEIVAGRPLRSPQIQLVTTGAEGSHFELTVDNADFEILRANKNEIGVVTLYEASVDGKITITAGDDIYTYFYVVPKVDRTPSNLVAKVSLIYYHPVSGPMKVTFNYSSLPASTGDSSEIWVYYVPANEYNITGKLKMYYQDYNHPLVPTPVQE